MQQITRLLISLHKENFAGKIEFMDRKTWQESRNHLEDDTSSDAESQLIPEGFMSCMCTPTPSINTTSVRRIQPQKTKAKIEFHNTMGVGGEKTKPTLPPDEFTQFGIYVANKLRKIHSSQIKFAEKLIGEVLFEAEMGTLNRNWKLIEDIGQFTQIGPGPYFASYATSSVEGSTSAKNREHQAGVMAQGSKDLTPTVEMELVPCRVCGRTFIPERIEYHESVCKSKRKEPRKPYDSVSHRWKGTDNEPAIKWIKSNSEPKPPRLNTILWRMMERPRPLKQIIDEEDEEEEEEFLVELTGENVLPV